MLGSRIARLGASALAVVLLAPLIYIFFSWHESHAVVWSHLSQTVLSEYVINSVLLALFAAMGTILLGTGSAYLVTQFDFVGRNTLQLMLILPLAMPAYITAYTYTGMFDFASPVHQFFRNSIGLSDETRILPDIRNLVGAIGVLILVLYPYVYMLARVAFQSQPQSFNEISALHNVTRVQHFLRVQVPLIRPAVLTGALLVMMESLADFGTVAYFGVNTFSTGIFRTWFGMGNPTVAAQLASLLCLFVFVVLYFEQQTRRDYRHYQSLLNAKSRPQKLTKPKQAVAFALCAIPVLFGFFLPVAQLTWWAVWVADNDMQGYLRLLYNSFSISAMAALMIVLLAVCFTTLARNTRSKQVMWMNKCLSLGYALPGIVIAVGVVAISGMLDRQINQLTNSIFEWRPGLVFSGTLVALVFAYAVRYLSVALQNTETGLARIPINLDDSAMLLNPSKFSLLIRIHLPLLKSSVLTAALLVFVDVLKELPATLVLRPFNFNTLAVKAYELATDERLTDAALPAISIVLIGLIPVGLLMHQLDRRQQ